MSAGVDRWGALLVLAVVAAVSAGCHRSGDTEAGLQTARLEWTGRLGTLRARQTAYAERVRQGRAAGNDGSREAVATARRLEVMSLAREQSLADGDRTVEELVNEVRLADDPEAALLDARLRMAESLAAQEAQLNDAEAQLPRQLASLHAPEATP